MRFPYLLVAERSVLGLVSVVIESLEAHGDPNKIYLVVPGAQLSEFARTRCRSHQLIAEEDVLPAWTLAKVRSMLPRHPDRAGWYLQQFLKLGFGMSVGISRYVVWDADTVMLTAPKFVDGQQVLMNAAREYHSPYFKTYERLLGRPPTLRKSMISQYMLIDTEVVVALKNTIERIHGAEWIEAILKNLSHQSASEFSEYETYANFLESERPGTVVVINEKWFRYGAELMPKTRELELKMAERKFRGYAYVAFERHKPSVARKMVANLRCMARL
jgi:hypothetical protein